MSQTVDLDEFITDKEAAKLMRLRPNTLEVRRHQGKDGPPFYKIGDAPNAPIRYLRSEVIAWIKEQAYRSTSAHTAAVRTKRENPMHVAPAAPGAVARPWETPKPASSGSVG